MRSTGHGPDRGPDVAHPRAPLPVVADALDGDRTTDRDTPLGQTHDPEFEVTRDDIRNILRRMITGIFDGPDIQLEIARRVLPDLTDGNRTPPDHP